MKEKPYMSALQKELLAEINKHPKKGDASRLLRLHPGFEGLNPSTFFRWLQKRGDQGQGVEGRIRAVIQILKKRIAGQLTQCEQKMCLSCGIG